MGGAWGRPPALEPVCVCARARPCMCVSAAPETASSHTADSCRSLYTKYTKYLFDQSQALLYCCISAYLCFPSSKEAEIIKDSWVVILEESPECKTDIIPASFTSVGKAPGSKSQLISTAVAAEVSLSDKPYCCCCNAELPPGSPPGWCG